MTKNSKHRIINFLICCIYILLSMVVLTTVTMPVWLTLILNNGELPLWLAIILK